VARDGSARRDLSCRKHGSGIICTYLANAVSGELQGSQIAALLVNESLDGAVTETAVEPPMTTLPVWIAAADRACTKRARAVGALPRLPALQTTARLIPIEQRFEQALVSVGNVSRTYGPASPSGLLFDFLGYEDHLIALHRHILDHADPNVTYSDYHYTRGGPVLAAQDAQQQGLNCDFRTFIPPPATPPAPPQPKTPPKPTTGTNAPGNDPSFAATDASLIIAANPNNTNIHCNAGTNGWTYICTYLNAGTIHRTGILAHGPGGASLAVDLPATGPIPPPPRH
jgi:hypothetical protein